MENTMQKLMINEVVCERTTQMMAQGEVVLPEQKSDMAKVMEASGNALISDFMSVSGGIDVTGKVWVNVIYIPEGDARVACSFKSELDFSQRIDDRSVENGDKCMMSCRIKCVDYNILNPRKISLKVVFEVIYKCVRQTEHEVIESFGENSGVAQKLSHLPVYQNISDTHAKFSVKELVKFDDNKPGAASLLDTKCSVGPLEIRMVTGKVAVRGTLSIDSVYVTDDNRIDCCSKELPFTEVFDAPGAGENTMCDVKMYVCEVSGILRGDDYGNMRSIDTDVLLGANISINDVCEMDFVSDCYGIKAPLECETENMNVDVLCGKCEDMCTVNGVLMPPTGVGMTNIYHASATPYVTSAELTDGKIAVKGWVEFSASFMSDSSHMPLSTLYSQEDFEMLLNAGDNVGNGCEVEACCDNFSYALNMSGGAEMRANIKVDAKMLENKDVSFYTKAEIGSEERKKKPKINIYFAKAGDTLWDIAKRYGIPESQLLDINHIESSDKINPGRQILIPEF